MPSFIRLLNYRSMCISTITTFNKMTQSDILHMCSQIVKYFLFNNNNNKKKKKKKKKKTLLPEWRSQCSDIMPLRPVRSCSNRTNTAPIQIHHEKTKTLFTIQALETLTIKEDLGYFDLKNPRTIKIFCINLSVPFFKFISSKYMYLHSWCIQ